MEAAAPPLEAEVRARGRRLAIASHPAGMTHRTVFTEHVPTLALVALGASEGVIGLQRAFEPLGQLLQLPTLRAVGRFSKRHILIGGHLLALAGSAPLLGYAALGIPGLLASLAVAAAGIVISQTVWFPLLRGYVESERVGRFFGMLRTGWHLALILYFLGAQYWLSRHPGSFAPLFAVGFACGVLRVFLIARLPERSEKTGRAIRVREAAALLRSEPRLRRYLLGTAGHESLRWVVLPFAIVWMRRSIGLSEGEVLLTTAAIFTGGLASLYASGRLVDRIGPAPVFRASTFGTALLYGALLTVQEPGPGAVAVLVVLFFGLAFLNASFGLADTHVLFGLAPPEAPARLLVVAIVSVSLCRGLAPLLVGVLLEVALARGVPAPAAYQVLFAGAALLEVAVYLPLRGFRA